MLSPMSKLQIQGTTTRVRLSPFRRHRAGRALSAHICTELDAGRTLKSILEDKRVQDRVHERPYLLEDLDFDQELAEAIRRASVPRTSAMNTPLPGPLTRW